jgi:hypothetical protein
MRFFSSEHTAVSVDIMGLQQRYEWFIRAAATAQQAVEVLQSA